MNVLYCAVSALYYCLLINTITTTICIYNKLTSLTTPLPSPPPPPLQRPTNTKDAEVNERRNI